MLGLSHRERMEKIASGLNIAYFDSMHEAWLKKLEEKQLKPKSIEYIARNEYFEMAQNFSEMRGVAEWHGRGNGYIREWKKKSEKNTDVIQQYINTFVEVCGQFGIDDVKGKSRAGVNKSVYECVEHHNEELRLTFKRGKDIKFEISI